jgi:hypothetical protein
MEGRLNSPPRPFSVNDAATPLSRSRPEAAIIDRQVRCGAVLAMTEQGMLRLVWRGTRPYCVYLKGPGSEFFRIEITANKNGLLRYPEIAGQSGDGLPRPR